MLCIHNVNQHNIYKTITILYPHMNNKLTIIKEQS